MSTYTIRVWVRVLFTLCLSLSFSLSLCPCSTVCKRYNSLFVYCWCCCFHGARCYGCQKWSKIQIMHVLLVFACETDFQSRNFFSFLFSLFSIKFRCATVTFLVVRGVVLFQYFFTNIVLLLLFLLVIVVVFYPFLGTKTKSKQYSSMMPSYKKTASWLCLKKKSRIVNASIISSRTTNGVSALI